MRWTIRLVLAGALLVSFAALTAAPASAHGTTLRCGQVSFTPNSDDLAGSIRATGLTCGLARDFIRDSEGRPGRRFRGFRCRSTDVDATLPYSRYRCVGAGDVITWRRY